MRWAASIGLRAIAVESQDHFEGPPTRPALRAQFFERDKQLHGTGELVSWTKGRELAGMGLEKVLMGLQAEYEAFLRGTRTKADVERGVCDLFMAARCGDYLDRLLSHLRSSAGSGWVGSIRNALAFELVTKAPEQLAHSHPFWQVGILPELRRFMPRERWGTGLLWDGFKRDGALLFGQLVFWSSGACGQILREAVLVDWTDLVVEQGLAPTLVGRNLLNPHGRTFASWLLRPVWWRCRQLDRGRPLREVVRSRAIQMIQQQGSPLLGPMAWRVEPRHWARILEWVLIWRRELTDPAMFPRAQALAALILRDDWATGAMQQSVPFLGLEHAHQTPAAVGDIPIRLCWEVSWSKPLDYRLTDELYLAIAAVVAAWLRGAGCAACTEDVFSKARWLTRLAPARRLRMSAVMGIVADYVVSRSDAIRCEGLSPGELEGAVAQRLGIQVADVVLWAQHQALVPDFLEQYAFALLKERRLAERLRLNIQERLEAAGSGLSGGISSDLRWGMSCVVERLKSLPADLSTPVPEVAGGSASRGGEAALVRTP